MPAPYDVNLDKITLVEIANNDDVGKFVAWDNENSKLIFKIHEFPFKVFADYGFPIIFKLVDEKKYEALETLKV